MADFGDVETFDSPVEFLNHFLGNGVKSLAQCKALQQTLVAEQDKLKDKVTDVSAPAATSNKKKALTGQRLEEEMKSLSVDVASTSEELDAHTESVTDSLSDLGKLVKRAAELEQCKAYLRCMDKIEHASCSIQSALLEESNTKAIDVYEEIVALHEKLRDTKCSNLLNFLSQTLRHWHIVLRDRINKELSIVMKTMEWPSVTTIGAQKTKPANLSEDPQKITTNLSKLFKLLLRIQLPHGVTDGVSIHPTIASLPNYKAAVLPLSLLVEPLRKRFQFHFYGSKQTNNPDKPEWFFTQLLTWAKDHADCLSTIIQPALWDSGYDSVNANVEFLRCLQILAMEKLISCIPEIMYDEHQYSHLIHETLSFHTDMIALHDYPSDEASCIHVLTAEEPFKKWIIIEKKFAQEKMDMMTESSTAWVSQFNADIDDDDEYKAAECAESFITLLTAITERYEPLPYPVCQLMFVCMKRELLEDYRIRLVQLRKEFSPISPQYLAILNTTHYIISVLRDWIEKPFFLRLQYQKSLSAIGNDSLSEMLNKRLSRNAAYQLPRAIDVCVVEDLECSLFDTSIQNIASLEEDMLKSLTNHILSDLKASLRTYADNNRSMWTALNHLKHKDEQAMITLSATACDFIIQLQNSLVMGKEALHRQLFTRFWQQIAQELDRLVYNMVISENHFSEGGVIQFNFDMTRNLFPIIGKYSSRPENFLKLCKESCQIMTMQLGDALLLKSTLAESLHSMDSQQIQDPISTVQELGIFKLSPEEVEMVLSRRNDLLRNI